MISEILTSFFYSAFSVSILLCYRAGKILNLSLASLFTLGAYLSQSPILAILLGAMVGFLLHKITKKLSITKATVFSLALAIAIEEFLRIIFKTEYVIFQVNKITLFGESILFPHLLAGIISMGFVILFLAFLFTEKSKNLKIVEEDPELAELYGVRVERMRMFILTSTGALIALLGSLQNPGIVYPTIGWQYLIFAVIVATFANIFEEKAYIFAFIFALLATCLPKLF
ncbi:MAG: hypothetical protein QXR27_04725 [Archaeoglobaceae archaeon]